MCWKLWQVGTLATPSHPGYCLLDNMYSICKILVLRLEHSIELSVLILMAHTSDPIVVI